MLQNLEEGISAIVCTLNNEHNIDSMLSSIKHQVSQIILADGGSSDKTIEIAKKHDAVISVTHPGFFIQITQAFNLVKCKYVLFCEADHIYPNDFTKKFIEEFQQNDCFVMKATLVCSKKDNFLEKGIDIFYQIHQIDKGIRPVVGGPIISCTKEFITYFHTSGINGYGIDTSLSEYWEQNSLKQIVGNTFAYHSDSLNSLKFLKKYFNYGKGDYEFYNAHKHKWTFRRKMKSIFHIFNRYIIDYPIKSFKIGKPHIAIPYLWLSALVRYSGWMYCIIINKKELSNEPRRNI